MKEFPTLITAVSGKVSIRLIFYSALASDLIETCLNVVSFCLLAFQRGSEGFWKSVAQYVPREPSEMRILNPFFIQEAAFQFIGLPLNNGLMGKGVSANLMSGRDK